jgi:mono/diheme cytochrome c family protein
MMRGLIILTFCSGSCEVPDPMRRQAKVRPYHGMRTPPPGTVPRESEPDEPPARVTRELIDLGQQTFDRTCATCHGRAGDGDSVVADKMSIRPPPSLLDAENRQRPAAEIEQVIRDGYGLMPGYRTQLTLRERWATVAYLRALQLSQGAPVADLPSAVRSELERGHP